MRRRCKRIAEPKVRIHSPPAVSQAYFRVAPFCPSAGKPVLEGPCVFVVGTPMGWDRLIRVINQAVVIGNYCKGALAATR